MTKRIIFVIILGIIITLISILLRYEDTLKQKVRGWLEIYDPSALIDARSNVLKINIDFLKERLDSLDAKLKGQLDKEVSLDISKLREFQLLHTDVGNFLISLQDVKPYLNGHKLFLHIGNPYNASFENIKLKARWAPCEVGKKKNVEFKESSLIETLICGYWNKVQLIVVPSQPQDLCQLYLSMDISKCVISLYEK